MLSPAGGAGKGAAGSFCAPALAGSPSHVRSPVGPRTLGVRSAPSTLVGQAITEIISPGHVYTLPAAPTTDQDG